MGKLNYIIGTGIITIILIIAGLTFQWQISKDHSTLYKEGEIIARHRWHIEAERTYINKNSWYRRNVICPRLVAQGGHETATRCYYPDDFYEQLSRSLINTEIGLNDNPFSVERITPFYAYGTSGSYAGFLNEFFEFGSERIEEFPSNYTIKWNPKDTRNYKLVWRIWELKRLNLPIGNYSKCSYNFGNIKIDLKEDCNNLEKAEVKDSETIWFYFNQSRGEQILNVDLVDPPIIFNDTFTDTGGTLLTAHTPTPTGDGWTQNWTAGGNLEIDINDLDHSGGNADGGIGIANPAPSLADYNVTATYSSADSVDDSVVLIGRYQNNSNFYAFRWTTTTRHDLYKVVAGSDTLLNNTCSNPAASDIVTLSFKGSVISVYINGALTCTATDSDISSAGYGGLGIGAGPYYTGDDAGTERLDDFFIQEADPPDNEYPQFSSYWDDNASVVDSGDGHFNVTVTSTNGTVYLEINGTNVTATNLTADVYNATYTFSSGGVYTYRWHSWGNGSQENYNKSVDRSYTVNITPEVGLDVLYPTQDISVNQNTFFNVTLNVSCNLGTCGIINVSLDPIVGQDEASDNYNLWGGDQLICSNFTAPDKGYIQNYSAYIHNGDDGDNFMMAIYNSTTLLGASEAGPIPSIGSDQWVNFSVDYDQGSSKFGAEEIWICGFSDTSHFYHNGTTYKPYTSSYKTATYPNLPSTPAAGAYYLYPYSMIAYYEVKGLISNVTGATPFYINNSANPYQTASLSSGQSEKVVFWINATGVTTEYDFFAFANLTSNASINNITDIWHVTITEVAADTCTYDDSGNWDVDCSDACTWNDPYNISGNLTLSGSGAVTLNALFSFNTSNQYRFQSGGCQLNINSGGGFE